MRTFSSYGPINKKLHYHAPRTELIDQITAQMRGNPEKHKSGLEGHYITVWAPRQTGKTWLMQEAMMRLRAETEYDVAIISMQRATLETSYETVLDIFVDGLQKRLDYELPAVSSWQDLSRLFERGNLKRPLILFIDEFDALEQQFIDRFAVLFRDIYIRCADQIIAGEEPDYLLHSLALIGVRSVLGVESSSGSPFNTQRNVHIPNLTSDEVRGIFQSYQEESGQAIEPTVVEQIYEEFRGQPGLTCWFGEQLTEQFNEHRETITQRDFDIVYSASLQVLPNNNIVNIISKAKLPVYRPQVLKMFQTDRKQPFYYDDPATNFLYMNGVVDFEVEDGTERYMRFPSPFVQRRLFNFFAVELFQSPAQLYDPLMDLTPVIDENRIDIVALMRVYEAYLLKNQEGLFRGVPRRAVDHRPYEAVYHFNLYMYLTQFLQSFDGDVVPEFPTGNGKVDLVLRYAGQVYGIEVKSFLNRHEYKKAIGQAARYAKKLQRTKIWLLFFIEVLDEKNRQDLEKIVVDPETGVPVEIVFVTTKG